MKKTGKNVEDERSKGRGSAPASGHPKVKSCSILLAMVMIFMLSVSLPAYATNATGGTVTYSGNYKIHTFTGSGTLNVTESGNVEYLVVGGGGGGQSAWGWGDGSGGGSGGGAGGYRSGTLSTTSKSYTITVGNGGGSDQKGGDSIFDTITATGGGSGSGGSGGSGGGGGGSGNTPSTSPSQGNNGGARSGKQGGGGGGIGAVGQNALAGNYGGAGGAGVYNSITGSSVGYAG